VRSGAGVLGSQLEDVATEVFVARSAKKVREKSDVIRIFLDPLRSATARLAWGPVFE
jgi:hypothetical protein